MFIFVEGDDRWQRNLSPWFRLLAIHSRVMRNSAVATLEVSRLYTELPVQRMSGGRKAGTKHRRFLWFILRRRHCLDYIASVPTRDMIPALAWVDRGGRETSDGTAGEAE
jgi:hypothetical protein